MLIIGLTGGIGSGKTTVTNLFAALGAPIIDADAVAREILTDNTKIREKIVTRFGLEILDRDQKLVHPQNMTQENNPYSSLEKSVSRLNRGKLQARIFESPSEKKWLENLLHPIITQEIKKRISNLKSPYCIVAIPLLAEISESQSLVNRILVVDTSAEEQLNRTMQRDALAEHRVKQIMNAQATRADRLSIADDVLHNESDVAALKQQVLAFHQRYLSLASNFRPASTH